jgi:hypothetical protein
VPPEMQYERVRNRTRNHAESILTDDEACGQAQMPCTCTLMFCRPRNCQGNHAQNSVADDVPSASVPLRCCATPSAAIDRTRLCLDVHPRGDSVPRRAKKLHASPARSTRPRALAPSQTVHHTPTSCSRAPSSPSWTRWNPLALGLLPAAH